LTYPSVNSGIKKETLQLDNILQDFRQYYASVQTKHQLGFDVPAGFHQDTSLQRQYQLNTPPRHLSSDASQPTLSDEPSMNNSIDPTPLILQSGSSITSDLLPILDHKSTVPLPKPLPIPLVRLVDKPSTSLPKHMSMTEDFLRACIGYRRIDTLKKNFTQLYQDSVKLDNLPADNVLDSGHLASLRKKDRNTTPVPRPSNFGDVRHVDIVFGPEISVGNIHYGLLFVDRFSRMSYLYPLQNLTTDIKKQLQAFFAHLGFIPCHLVSDFDLKLIGGTARDYLNSLLVHINAAPPYRQAKMV